MGKREEKKEMRFADSALLERKTFDTLVNIRQVQARESGKWFTIITIGAEQDKQFMVCGRSDGKGTTLMTDWEQVQRTEDRIKADVESI